MQMFMWWSDLLQNYAQGRLIAVADDADTARQMIAAQYEVWVKEHREWWLFEDDHEQIDQGRAQLTADLAPEPETFTVLYVAGSE